MREVSFVKCVKFGFKGNVTKNALVIGDADNDDKNELVCANLQGDLAIFKDSNISRYAHAKNLGMVTACCIGNFTNQSKNHIAAINMDGWLYMLNIESNSNNSTEIVPFYQQRMPANCKILLIADLDGDGQKELIIGLTDRVLRTYRWINVSPDRGKFIGIYKWEFADQIGAISLNPSQHENCLDIIVAQPGGTFAKLECIDKKSSSDTPNAQRDNQEASESIFCDDNVKTEKISRLTPEYHQLAQSRMRNHHISTEVLGGIKNGSGSDNYSSIVVATLDGILMIVNNDDILWSKQLDNQLFALSLLTTPSSQLEEKQYFVACAWNGKTYIFDEDKNILGFKFGEAVSAFTAGNYFLGGVSHPSLVYCTFDNQIYLYYGITADDIKPNYLLEEIVSNPKHSEILEKLFKLARKLGFVTGDNFKPDDESHLVILRKFLSEVLKNINFDDIKVVPD